MQLNFSYQQSTNKQEAYSKVLAQLESEEFKQLDLDVELECLQDSIQASGKGFSLQADFSENEVMVKVKLSLFLKPFSKKIESKLSAVFASCV